jgi:L-ribulokinase
MPVKVAASFQAVALGAAIFAAVASGHYTSISQAQQKMASSILTTYKPDRANADTYRRLYGIYKKLGDSLEEILRKL